MVAPMEPDTLRHRVTDRLTEAFHRGELQPGERIVESKLAQALHISKGTLREALQELQHLGIVTKRDNQGTFVTKLGEKEVGDIYDVRRALEPLAAVLAQQRLTDEHCRRLRTLVDDLRAAASQKDFIATSRNDLAFHQLIWKISGNRSLEKALTVVTTPLFAFYSVKLFSGIAVDPAKLYAEHAAMLAALKEGDAEEVRKMFVETTDSARRHSIEGLRYIEAHLLQAIPER